MLRGAAFTKITIFACLFIALLLLLDTHSTDEVEFQSNNFIALRRRASSDLPPVAVPATSKRSSPSSQLLVSAQSLKGSPTEVMSTDARKSQLAYLGFSKPKSVDEWRDWVAKLQVDYAGYTISPQGVLTDANFGALARAIVIGIFMTVFVPFITCCFSCWRTCCNTCGGRKPSPNGYSRRHLLFAFGAFAAIGVLNLTFSAILISYSTELTSTLQSFEKGAKALVTDGAAFAQNGIDGLAQTPSILNDVIQSVGNTLANGTMRAELNSTFYGPVHSLIDDLNSLGNTLLGGRTTINDTDILVQSMKVRAKSVPATMNNLADQVDQLRYLTFNGTVWTVPGFPSSSSMRNVSFPSLDNLPNLKSFADDFSVGNSLKDMATMLDNMYRDYVDNMPTAVNRTFRTLLNTDSLVGGFVSSANSSVQGLSSQASDISDSIADIFSTYVYPYDAYRHVYFSIVGSIVLVTLVISWLSPVVRRHRLTLPFLCTFALISILLWIQFVLFYAISAPLNIVCDSRDAVLNRDYRLSELSSIISFIPNTTVAVNPTTFLESCRTGRTIFSADINKDGDSMITLAVAVINLNINMVDSMVDSTINLNSIIDAFDPSKMLDSVDVKKLSNFNFSAYNFPDISNSISVLNTTSEVNSTMSSLTAASFDADRGNVNTMQAYLDAFNLYAQTLNPTWTNFTYNSVVQTYVVTGTAFDPQVVTGSGSDPNNPTVTAKFNSAYWRIVFIYQAETAIAVARSNTSTTLSSVNSARTQQLKSLEDDYLTVKTTMSSMQTLVVSIQTGFNAIKTSLDALMATLRSYTSRLMYFIKLAVRLLIEGILGNLLVNNPNENFANCQAIAEDMTFILDGFCNNLVNVLSGFWYDGMLLAIFMIFGFITTMIAKKRTDYLAKRSKVADEVSPEQAEKTKSVDRPVKEHRSVMKTAFVEEVPAATASPVATDILKETSPTSPVDVSVTESYLTAPESTSY